MNWKKEEGQEGTNRKEVVEITLDVPRLSFSILSPSHLATWPCPGSAKLLSLLSLFLLSCIEIINPMNVIITHFGFWGMVGSEKKAIGKHGRIECGQNTHCMCMLRDRGSFLF